MLYKNEGTISRMQVLLPCQQSHGISAITKIRTGAPHKTIKINLWQFKMQSLFELLYVFSYANQPARFDGCCKSSSFLFRKKVPPVMLLKYDHLSAATIVLPSVVLLGQQTYLTELTLKICMMGMDGSTCKQSCP